MFNNHVPIVLGSGTRKQIMGFYKPRTFQSVSDKGFSFSKRPTEGIQLSYVKNLIISAQNTDRICKISYFVIYRSFAKSTSSNSTDEPLLISKTPYRNIKLVHSLKNKARS